MFIKGTRVPVSNINFLIFTSFQADYLNRKYFKLKLIQQSS